MKNVGVSAQAKLKNLSVRTGLDMPTLLRRYAQERLLYRLSVSPEAANFVLKGGLLLAAYNFGSLLRPTEDIDFNGLAADGNVERLRKALDVVLTQPVPDDGVEFDASSMRIAKDRIGIVPGGKVALVAKVGTARIDLRVDVGFGNPVTPEVRLMEFPALLDDLAPRPVMNSYPLETVIAEKLHAMAQFGMANTRLKDLYDVWMLSRLHEFEADMLADAVENTFRHQQRAVPERFACLSSAFAAESRKGWKAFVSKLPDTHAFDLEDIVGEIAEFLLPVAECARSGARSSRLWIPREGWHSPSPAP